MDLTRVLVLIFALAQAGLGLSVLGHFLLGVWEGSKKTNVKNSEVSNAGETGVEKNAPRIKLH